MPRDAREPSPADPSARTLAQIATAFARIAQDVGSTAAADPSSALAEAKQRCESGAGDRQLAADVRQLLGNLATAVEVWQSVWPRLGRQGDFRAAVIREAGQWARKLELLAQQKPPR